MPPFQLFKSLRWLKRTNMNGWTINGGMNIMSLNAFFIFISVAHSEAFNFSFLTIKISDMQSGG